MTPFDTSIGIFVGGGGSRMGGVAKGLLCDAEGTPLVQRLESMCHAALPEAPLVLVGKQAAYEHLNLPSLEDDPKDVGPLGGLRALLLWSAEQGCTRTVALAGDMPFVTAALVEHLATGDPGAAALAPQREGRWEPLCARYRVDACLPVVEELLATGQRALFRLLERVGATELELTADERELLVDWDTPADLTRVRPDGA